jgi:hypothetical protein
VVLVLIFVQQNGFAQDSTSIAKTVKHKPQKDPLKATMFAVVCPGLGQIYNRKYWKIPLVYIGFGAVIYTAGINSKYYTEYMQAYQDFTDTNPLTKRYEKLIREAPIEYDRVLHPDKYQLYKEQMLRMIDYYKRYRDLSYIGIAGWYLISILDANVDASLYNYDISNNLNITLVPIQMSLPGGFVGAGLSVDLIVNF